MENNFVPVETAAEVEEDLKKEYEKKLRVDDTLIPDPFWNPTWVVRRRWRNDSLVNAVISRYI